MVKSLVIVESPTKMKTIRNYLGHDYEVRASIGHVVDLPKSRMGIDLENSDFTPEYVPIKGKLEIIKDIQKLSKTVQCVYLALDPDREGEAIAFHLEQLIRKKNPSISIYRIKFNEITEKAIKKAILCPVELNSKLYDAQQARRILDRIVGYKISPILWSKIRKGLSAGRVQSVALRLIVDREREIQNFERKEYWTLKAVCNAEKAPTFISKLIKIDEKKNILKNNEEAIRIKTDLQTLKPIVSCVIKKKRSKHPSAPFITSKLQQDAARAFNFSAKKTMIIAQSLYEGIKLGDEGTVGLITYMRTDSNKINDDFVNLIREYIIENVGFDFISKKPNLFKNNDNAQEAHEAIRPTSLNYSPEFIASYVNADQLKLYKLIWERCLASQMSSAQFDQTVIDIRANQYLFRASGSTMVFEGFLKIYNESQDKYDTKSKDKLEEEKNLFPSLNKGDSIFFDKIDIFQHFTMPSARFTEASLVEELEKKGIGRPSTYANILSLIQEKDYVKKDGGRFFSSEIGFIVSDLLTSAFPQIFDITFTANMEKKLDKIEIGEICRKDVLQDFYKSFMESFQKVKELTKNIKPELTNITCPKCKNQKMILKWGKCGKFLGCPSYPDCKQTLVFLRNESGEIIPETLENLEPRNETCKLCNCVLIVKYGKYGSFLGCSNYPDCLFVTHMPTGIKCPKCGFDMVARKSKSGKTFYGCSNYPNCNHIFWRKPKDNNIYQSCNDDFVIKNQNLIDNDLKCSTCEH